MTDFNGNVVKRFNVGASSSPAGSTPVTGNPRSIAFDSSGTAAWVTDATTGKLHRILVADGTETAISTPSSALADITAAGDGRLYAADRTNSGLLSITPDGPPEFNTVAVGGVTQTTALATFNADPFGTGGSVKVEYGLTTAYGSSSSAYALPEADGFSAGSLPLTNLTPGTTYHYRVVATNTVGSQVGADATFTTLPPSGPPPPPLKPAKVGGSISATFSFRKRVTKLTALTLKSLPAGATVTVTCTARRCAFTKKTVKITKPTKSLALKSIFKGRKIRPGTVITVTITAPGFIGSVRRYTVQARKKPTSKALCLPLGTSAPVAC